MITPKVPRDTADVARHYDALDFFYRDTWGQHLHHGYWETGRESTEAAVAHLTRTVAELTGIAPGTGARVCDIGCGYGGTSWFLAKIYGARVTGYTLSGEQRRHAEAHGADDSVKDAPAPEFIRGDWLDNTLPDASIDAVVSIECVSHVGDKARFFREIARALRPGGRAVICAWLSGEKPSPWRQRHLLEPICREGCLPGLASLKEYAPWILDAGLELVEQRVIGREVRKTWRIILGRVAWRVLTQRRYFMFLITQLRRDAQFALAVPRLLAAYHTGALDYAIFVARKPLSRPLAGAMLPP